MRWVSLGAVLGMLAVAAGAFGAHGLRGRLAPELLEVYRTAAHYHLLHALALTAYGVWRDRQPVAAWPGWAFFGGLLLFSGSLYLMTLSGWRWLGAITPFGGLALMAGWLGWAWQARHGVASAPLSARG